MTEVTGPRAYTADEVRDELLEHIWTMVRYWGGRGMSNVDPDRPKDECLEGLAFSILSALDGCSMELPAFKLVIDPHSEDEAFHRAEGRNWYPAGGVIEDMLHEHFYRDVREQRGGHPMTPGHESGLDLRRDDGTLDVSLNWIARNGEVHFTIEVNSVYGLAKTIVDFTEAEAQRIASMFKDAARNAGEPTLGAVPASLAEGLRIAGGQRLGHVLGERD